MRGNSYVHRLIKSTSPHTWGQRRYPISLYFYCLKMLTHITTIFCFCFCMCGYKKGGWVREVLSLRKGVGRRGVLPMLKGGGGQNKFWGSFEADNEARSLMKREWGGGGAKYFHLLKGVGGWGEGGGAKSLGPAIFPIWRLPPRNEWPVPWAFFLHVRFDKI